MDEFEEHLGNIAWHQMFRYEVFWDNGVKDVLENNDIPLSWQVIDMENKAIIIPSDPFGVPLSLKKNEEQTKKMVGHLRKIKRKYNRVEREFLDPVTFEPSGNIKRGCLIHDISEAGAEEIGLLFGASFILHFKMDPDLIIEIIPIPIVHGEMRGLLFSFD